MPKDNRKILNAVQGSNRQLFKDGMEDELAAEATQERLDQLKRDGVISGDWQSAKSSIHVSGDAPSREFSDRARLEGIEISGTNETGKFEPLSVEETLERMMAYDFSEDVTRSMTFHGDALKEAMQKPLSERFTETKSNKPRNRAEKTANAGVTTETGKDSENSSESIEKTDDNQPNEEDEFPANFPARAKFIKADRKFADVKMMTREQLIEIDGIAEKSADEVLAYFAETAK